MGRSPCLRHGKRVPRRKSVSSTPNGRSESVSLGGPAAIDEVSGESDDTFYRRSPRGELVGVSAKRLVHPDYHHVFEEFRAIHATRNRFCAETLDVRKDGTRIHVEVHGTGFEYRGAPHLLAIVRGITERKQAEVKLAETNERLVEASRQTGMAEVATGVLHNVGNVLTSVNVSAQVMTEKLERSHVAGLAKAVALFDTHAHDLAAYITSDERGRHLPNYLKQVTKELASERESLLSEVKSLRQHVEHINEIINVQQSFARLGGLVESVDLMDIVEDALKVNEAGLSRHRVEVKREFEPVPIIATDKNKVLQIRINLISNAKYALSDSGKDNGLMTIRVGVCRHAHAAGMGWHRDDSSLVAGGSGPPSCDLHGLLRL